jgi:hypothetical protein
MKANAAKREFENYLAKKGLSLRALTPEEGFAACLDFYRNVRATDCEDHTEADMLLAQWGVFDWGRGEHFSFDITRQFILSGGEDEDIFQLSLTFRFPPAPDLRAFAQGNRSCQSHEEIPVFEEFVRLLPAYLGVATRRDAQLESKFGLRDRGKVGLGTKFPVTGLPGKWLYGPI